MKKIKKLYPFTYEALHDLKAPLKGINNLGFWTEKDKRGNILGETKQNLALMRNRVNWIQELSADILQYSRTGIIIHKAITFNLKKSIEDLISSFNTPGKFKISLSDSLPLITTEKIAFEQAFVNYTSSTIKFNKIHAQSIYISWTRKGNFYEFCEADNGPEIEKEFHEKIFVFFQALEARETFKCTVVDLAIVKKIVVGKDGRVWAKPVKDADSKFYFYWPINEKEGEV